MKILFIGGTGVISTDAVELAVIRQMDVYILNRGYNKAMIPSGVNLIICDVNNQDDFYEAVSELDVDVVVDCISYKPEQLVSKLNALRGHYKQYIFISSTAVYQVPWSGQIHENTTPTTNFGWDYARNKVGCEYELARETRLYGSIHTIVRPSETYNRLRIPGVIVFNPNRYGYTVIERLLKGKRIIVHDDGLAQTPFTHAHDFAQGLIGLFLNEKAYGEAFHITSDEILSWRDVTQMVADASGTKAHICYIPSIELVRIMPRTPHGDTYGVIMCAKAYNKIFDNSKIKSAVPDFKAATSFEDGIRDTINYYNKRPELKTVDEYWDAEVDRVIQKWESRTQMTERRK